VFPGFALFERLVGARYTGPWEYQPLGPFLANSFRERRNSPVDRDASEALAEPYRLALENVRTANPPSPLFSVSSIRRLVQGAGAIRQSSSKFSSRPPDCAAPRELRKRYRDIEFSAHAYWKRPPSQMVNAITPVKRAAISSPGDLFGTRTQSGADQRREAGSLFGI